MLGMACLHVRFGLHACMQFNIEFNACNWICKSSCKLCHVLSIASDMFFTFCVDVEAHVSLHSAVHIQIAKLHVKCVIAVIPFSMGLVRMALVRLIPCLRHAHA